VSQLPGSGKAKAALAALEALRTGEVVLLDTDSLPGLHALASLESAAIALRKSKDSRSERPFLLLFPSLDAVLSVAHPFRENDLLLLEEQWPGPLTVLLRPKPAALASWSDGEGHLAARVPAAAGLRSLLERLDGPLFSTSANREGKAPARSLEEAQAFFPRLKAFALGEASPGEASTLVDLSGPRPQLLRKGLAPWPPA